MTYYPTFFHPSPVVAVKVHVGAADVARQKIYQYLSNLNLGFSYVFDFDVVWSTVNGCLQNIRPLYCSCRADLSLLFLFYVDLNTQTNRCTS